MNRAGQGQPLLPRLVVATRDILELLHQSDSGVARFRKRELLTEADSRSAIERQVFLVTVSMPENLISCVAKRLPIQASTSPNALA